MSTRHDLLPPQDFQKALGVQAEFRGQSVFIAKAYSVNGKFYDITYDTSNEKLQKLRAMGPDLLVQHLQEQMRAYLTASNALAAPEKTAFELTSKNDVFALPQGQQKYSISDRQDPVTGRTMKAFAETFHQTFGLNAPAEDPVPKPADETGEEDAMDRASETETSSDGNAQETDETETQSPKAPRNLVEDISRPVRIAGDVNNIGVGVAAAMTGTAPATGFSMYAICIGAGIGILGNIKEIYDYFVHGKPLPENFGWKLLSNLCLFLGPLLLLVGAFSNPYTAAAVLIGLTVIGLAAYVKANWDAIKERFSEMSGLERVLYAVCFATILGVTAFGVPGAPYIAMAAMTVPVGAEVYNLYKKAKQAPAEVPPLQQPHRLSEEQRIQEERFAAQRLQALQRLEQERLERERSERLATDQEILAQQIAANQ